MTPKVFISYRRDDSAGQVGRIHDRLEQEFGGDNLFMDVDSVPLGVNFVKMLHDETKRLDPPRLTTVSLGFAKNYFEPHNADLRLADVVDFYSFHYYDDDPYDSGRYAGHWYYGQGFPADLRRAIQELVALKLDKPILISELGFPTGPSARRTPDDLRRDLQAALQTARAERASGIILWPFQERMEELVGDIFTK